MGATSRAGTATRFVFFSLRKYSFILGNTLRSKFVNFQEIFDSKF
jgi:hypothetical protein